MLTILIIFLIKKTFWEVKDANLTKKGFDNITAMMPLRSVKNEEKGIF